MGWKQKLEASKKCLKTDDKKKVFVGIAYEVGSVSQKERWLCFNLFDVYQDEAGYYSFENMKTIGKYDSTCFDAMDLMKNQEQQLRQKEYLTKNAWLAKQKTALPNFDAIVESMMESSHLQALGPIGEEKAWLIYKIVETLGYFNVNDIRIILNIIDEMDTEKDRVQMASHIASFIAQTVCYESAGPSVQDTDMAKKHYEEGKTYTLSNKKIEKDL